MTTLITADLHLGDNPRDVYRHKFMEQLPALLKKHKATRLLVLGDLTEEKDRHSAWLVNKMVEYFFVLHQVCQVMILRGNHDYIDINNPFFRFLQCIEGIGWIDRPYEADGCLFLPHTTNWKRDWDKLRFEGRDWIFAHNTFEGADVGHGRKLSGIPTNIFPDDNVISGDVHIPQKLGQVEYVGAPYTVDFGDDYEGRVLRLTKHGVTSIPLTTPQKRLVEVSELKELTKVKHVKQGDILKVRYFLAADQQPRWSEIQAAIREWSEKHGYILHTTQPVVVTNRLGGEKAKRKVIVRSDQQLLESYAKQRGVDPRTLKTGLTLMGKV